MKLRYLIIMPLLLAAVFLVIDLWLHGDTTNPNFRRIQVEIVKLMWIAGALAAALKFEKGEYLRRAWMLLVFFMVMLVLRDITVIIRQFGIEVFPNFVDPANVILVFVANLLGVAGIFMLARAWKVADIELPGPKWGQLLVVLVVAVMSIAIAGPGVVSGMLRVADGRIRSLVVMVSSLGDICILCLIAPLLLTALALRGGFLSWPWVLMTASSLGWLFYDATYFLYTSFYAEEVSRTGVLVSEFFRSLACLYGFTAGIAQRIVVEKVRNKLGKSGSP